MKHNNNLGDSNNKNKRTRRGNPSDLSFTGSDDTLTQDEWDQVVDDLWEINPDAVKGIVISIIGRHNHGQTRLLSNGLPFDFDLEDYLAQHRL